MLFPKNQEIAFNGLLSAEQLLKKPLEHYNKILFTSFRDLLAKQLNKIFFHGQVCIQECQKLKYRLQLILDHLQLLLLRFHSKKH